MGGKSVGNPPAAIQGPRREYHTGWGIDPHARLVICFRQTLAFRSGFLLRGLQCGAFRLTAGLIDLDRREEDACADASGGVLSAMGDKDVCVCVCVCGCGGWGGGWGEGGGGGGGEKSRGQHV